MSQNSSNTNSSSEKIIKSSLLNTIETFESGNIQTLNGEALDETYLDDPTIMIKSSTAPLPVGIRQNQNATSNSFMTHVASFELRDSDFEKMMKMWDAKEMEDKIDREIGNRLFDAFLISDNDVQIMDSRKQELIDFIDKQIAFNKSIYKENTNFQRLALESNRVNTYVSPVPGFMAASRFLGDLDCYKKLIYSQNPVFLIHTNTKRLNGQTGFGYTTHPGLVNMCVNYLRNRNFDHKASKSSTLSHTRSNDKVYTHKMTTATMMQHLYDMRFYFNFGFPVGYILDNDDGGLDVDRKDKFFHYNDQTYDGIQANTFNKNSSLEKLGCRELLSGIDAENENTQWSALVDFYDATVTSQEASNSLQGQLIQDFDKEPVGIGPNGELLFITTQNEPGEPTPAPNDLEVNLIYRGPYNLKPYDPLNPFESPGSRVQQWFKNNLKGYSLEKKTAFSHLSMISSILACESNASLNYTNTSPGQLSPLYRLNSTDNHVPGSGLGTRILTPDLETISDLPTSVWWESNINTSTTIALPEDTDAAGIKLASMFKIKNSSPIDSPNQSIENIHLYENSVSANTEILGTDVYEQYVEKSIGSSRNVRKEYLRRLDKLFEGQADVIQDTSEGISYLSGYPCEDGSTYNSQTPPNSPVFAYSAITSLFRKLLSWHEEYSDRNTGASGGDTNFEEKDKLLIFQMSALAASSKNFTGAAAQNLNKKTFELRDQIVRAICYRDIQRCKETTADNSNSHSRTVGYTWNMLNRSMATLELTENKPWTADKCFEKTWKCLLYVLSTSLTVPQTIAAKEVAFGNNASTYFKRSERDDIYVHEYSTLKSLVDIVNGFKSTDNDAKDLYDHIIDVVDILDRYFFLNGSRVSNTTGVGNFSSIGGTGNNYFKSNAGVTKANRFDRSILIALVTEAISKFLNDFFVPRFTTESGTEWANQDTIKDKKCVVELITRSYHGNGNYVMSRNRNSDHSKRDGNQSENSFYVNYPHQTSDSYRWRDGLDVRKIFALLTSCSFVTSAGEDFSPNLNDLPTKNASIKKVNTEEQYKNWFRACVGNFIVNTSAPSWGNSVSQQFPLSNTNLDKIFAKNIQTLGLISGIPGGGNGLTDHIMKTIINCGNSDRAGLKSFMEVCFLHDYQTRMIKRTYEAHEDTDNVYGEDADYLANTPKTVDQALKRHNYFLEMKESLQGLNQNDGTTSGVQNKLCILRSTLNVNVYRLISSFLKTMKQELSISGPKNFTMYGIKGESFYSKVNTVYDNKFSNPVPFGKKGSSLSQSSIISYAPVILDIEYKKILAIEPEIVYNYTNDKNPDVDLNITLNERFLKSTVPSGLGLNAGAFLNYNVKKLRFYFPTEIHQKVGQYGGDFLDFDPKNLGFTYQEYVDQILGGSDTDEAFLKRLTNVVKNYCFKVFYSSILDITLDEKHLLMGKQVTLDKMFLDELASAQTSELPSNISMSEVISLLTSQEISSHELLTGMSIEVSGYERRDYEDLQDEFKPKLYMNDDGTTYFKSPRISDSELYTSDVLFSSLLSKNKFSFLGTPIFDKMIVLNTDYDGSINTSSNNGLTSIFLENGSLKNDMATIGSSPVQIAVPKTTLAV